MENQMILQSDNNVLVMRYAEVVLQFGYITMFAPAFPLAPLFSMLCNLLELKINLNNMAYNNKRFIAMGASGIGSWSKIIEFLSLVSMLHQNQI